MLHARIRRMLPCHNSHYRLEQLPDYIQTTTMSQRLNRSGSRVVDRDTVAFSFTLSKISNLVFHNRQHSTTTTGWSLMTERMNIETEEKTLPNNL
jgi:hypothetical protein